LIIQGSIHLRPEVYRHIKDNFIKLLLFLDVLKHGKYVAAGENFRIVICIFV